MHAAGLILETSTHEHIYAENKISGRTQVMQTQQATFTTDNFAAIRTWYWLCINKRYHTRKLIGVIILNELTELRSYIPFDTK